MCKSQYIWIFKFFALPLVMAMLLNFLKNFFLFWGKERTFYVFAEVEILDYI